MFAEKVDNASSLRVFLRSPSEFTEQAVNVFFGHRADFAVFESFGGRTTRRIRDYELSYLPFPESIREHVVSVFRIHGSIARVINRNTTATCFATSTRHTDTGEFLQIYNCRSSAEWKEDMALSVTYSHKSRSTKAVLYGCTEKIRDTLIQSLRSCTYGSHPLAIPTLFCDIERDRHFDLVNPIIKRLVDRALNITKPQRPGRGVKRASNATTSTQATGLEHSSEDLMTLWIQVSDLKRGLETWKRQLDNLIRHGEGLSVGGSPQAVKDVEDTDERQFIDGGRRIHERLEELKGEYDEKIRQCADIIDGTVLAAQLEWNHIGQADTQTNLDISETNIEIAKASQADSRQMRSISMLTMVFLPATFVATVFSMTFFNWSPDQDGKVLSPWFWLYIVITAAFTIGTMCIWFYFNRRIMKTRNQDLEHGSTFPARTVSKEDWQSAVTQVP